MPAWITSLLRDDGLRADQLVLLQHHDLVAGIGQRPRDGQAHDAGADDDGFDICGHGLLPCALRLAARQPNLRSDDRPEDPVLQPGSDNLGADGTEGDEPGPRLEAHGRGDE